MKNQDQSMSATQPLTDESTEKLQTQLLPMRPAMFVVGDTLKSNEVALELKRLGISAIKTKYIKDIKERFSGDELGIIYVAPLIRGDLISVHKNLKKAKKFRNIPCFAVIPEWVNGRRERQMYQNGIRMIFEWPKEKSMFSQVLTTALLSGTEKVVSNDSDESLEKAIHNRMSGEYGNFAPEFQTTIYNGIVILKGRVGSVARKRDLVNKIKTIPGVRGVVDESLHVEDIKLPAQVLRKTANEILDRSMEVDTRTLDVTVSREDSQKLILRGTVTRKESAQFIKAQLEKIHGVKSVINKVDISPTAHRKDNNLAHRAQRVAKKLTLGTKGSVQVKVAHGEAFIRGTIASSIEKKHLTKALQKLDGINMVYNLTEFSGPN